MRSETARIIEVRPGVVALSERIVTRVVVVLLRGESEAVRLAQVLADVGLDDTAIVVPPVRGVAFFVDPSDEVDEWWGRHVPRNAEYVYILGEEPGIVQWTSGVDGICVVGVDEPSEITRYAGMDRIRAVYVSDVLDYVITVAHEFGSPSASVTAASLLGGVHGRPSRRGPKPPTRFRRARLDAETELRVAVPSNAQPRPAAPRPPVEPDEGSGAVGGSEAFFTPTKPESPAGEGDAAVAS